MRSRVINAFIAALLASAAGCSSEPHAAPVGQRAPGKDISAADRADKRGDVPANLPPGK